MRGLLLHLPTLLFVAWPFEAGALCCGRSGLTSSCPFSQAPPYDMSQITCSSFERLKDDTELVMYPPNDLRRAAQLMTLSFHSGVASDTYNCAAMIAMTGDQCIAIGVKMLTVATDCEKIVQINERI
jgi:hypothetical protein